MPGNYNSNTSYLFDEFSQSVVTVNTSATELYTGGSRNARRQVVRIYNDGSITAYIGPSGVTSSGSTKGESLAPRQSITYTLGDVAIYGITASSSTSIIVTELA